MRPGHGRPNGKSSRPGSKCRIVAILESYHNRGRDGQANPAAAAGEEMPAPLPPLDPGPVSMRKIVAMLMIVAVIGVVGLFAILATMDLPPPAGPVEIPIPNDRLQQ
jgi:hypothetical protein